MHSACVSNSQDYGYDANSNRTQLTVNGTGYAQTVAATSNRVTATAGPTANIYQYDANGSRTSDNATSYTYDVRGRLVQAGGASYTVNSLGQRIAKQYSGQTTVFHYDQGGRLIAESDEQGNFKREYLYLQNTPVAIVDFGTELRYVHSDHLGTARLVTDGAKQAIWAWQGEPFGSTEPNGDPEGTNAPYTLNLRFPGQYYDQETGLYYNYHRDYDAKLGRYVQSDPIGLKGGVNTYAYALGNPISYSDVTGLDIWLEGPSGAEPSFHQSVNVGNPNGQYRSYSFGMNGNGLEGEVYRDESLGGRSIHTKKRRQRKTLFLGRKWSENLVRKEHTDTMISVEVGVNVSLKMRLGC